MPTLTAEYAPSVTGFPRFSKKQKSLGLKLSPYHDDLVLVAVAIAIEALGAAQNKLDPETCFALIRFRSDLARLLPDMAYNSDEYLQKIHATAQVLLGVTD